MHQPHGISSSIESSDKDSREGTPSSPSKKFFNRSLSGPGSGSGGGTSGSLSPGIDIPSRKSSQGSQGSHGSHGSHGSSKNLDVVGNRENGQSFDTVNYKRYLERFLFFFHIFTSIFILFFVNFPRNEFTAINTRFNAWFSMRFNSTWKGVFSVSAGGHFPCSACGERGRLPWKDNLKNYILETPYYNIVINFLIFIIEIEIFLYNFCNIISIFILTNCMQLSWSIIWS